MRRDFLRGIYAKVHRDWLADYHGLSDSDRRAEFFKLLFTQALRNRSCSHRMAVVVAQYLPAGRTRKIDAPELRSDLTGHANIVICDIIGQVMRRLSDRECLIFLYMVFAGLSADEVAGITTLKRGTVMAKSRKSMNLLTKMAMRQVKMDRELLAIIREAARKEGVRI